MIERQNDARRHSSAAVAERFTSACVMSPLKSPWTVGSTSSEPTYDEQYLSKVDHELRFDGKSETFVDDRKADKLLTREYRKGFVGHFPGATRSIIRRSFRRYTVKSRRSTVSTWLRACNSLKTTIDASARSIWR